MPCDLPTGGDPAVAGWRDSTRRSPRGARLRRAAIDRGRGPTADGCETRRGGDRAEGAALASAWPSREKSIANAADGSIGRFLPGTGLVESPYGSRLKARPHV